MYYILENKYFFYHYQKSILLIHTHITGSHVISLVNNAMSGTPTNLSIPGEVESSSLQGGSAQIITESSQGSQQPADNDFAFFKNFKEYVRVITDNERGMMVIIFTVQGGGGGGRHGSF